MTLLDIPGSRLSGRRALVRVDFNVPLDEAGDVADDTRIRESIPTLEHLAAAGARIVALSHLGRPDGAPDPAFSLAPVAARLAELSDLPVRFVPATIGAEVEAAVEATEPGSILLLENTRFLAGETANDPQLAAELARLGDIFVQDAFGAVHRAHASTDGVPRAVRAAGGLAVGGLLLAKELRFLRDALDEPERPFVAILGGAKISGKIDVIEALLPRVDRLVIGGAMANTFLLAAGYPVGASLVEPDRVEMARGLLDRAGDRILLPVDVRVAEEIGEESQPRAVARDAVGDRDRIGDIGPTTERLFAEELAAARTVVWNGPMGVFELTPFAEGTIALAGACAVAADGGATVIIGGGDSAAAVSDSGLTARMTHISTGGGAALELLAGASLPGVEALSTMDEAAAGGDGP